MSNSMRPHRRQPTRLPCPWVAISFSNAWKWKVKVRSLSHVRLFATPWTAAHQAPPSMGFSRQEYWSGVPSPSLHDLGYLTWKSRPSLLLSLVNSVSFLFLLWESVPPSTCISTSIPVMVISNFNHYCDRLGIWWYYDMWSSPVVLVGKNLPAIARD